MQRQRVTGVARDGEGGHGARLVGRRRATAGERWAAQGGSLLAWRCAGCGAQQGEVEDWLWCATAGQGAAGRGG